MGEGRVHRRLAAILAADVVGFSRLMGADEEETLTRLNTHRRDFLEPTVAEHNGRIVKRMGDGLLIEFSSAVDATRCAIKAQKGMAHRNADIPPDRRIEIRIGIHVGDIIIEEEDIFGDGVNIAARLEGIAEPGGICISTDTFRQVRGKVDAHFEDAGDQQLKHIEQPMKVYRIRARESGERLASAYGSLRPVLQSPETNYDPGDRRSDAHEPGTLIRRLLSCARQVTDQSESLHKSGSYVPQRCDMLSASGRLIKQDVLIWPVVKELTDRSEHARILLTGDYGYGKTSFCQMLTAELCDAAEGGDATSAIPLYLSLSSSVTDLNASIEENLAEYAKRYGATISVAEISEALCSFPNLFIVLDGLDELAGRADFAKVQMFVRWLEQLPRKRSVKVLVTSRSMLFQRERDYHFLQPTNVFRLNAFHPTELVEYLLNQSSASRDSIGSILANDRLRETCATPINAMLLASYIRNYGPDRIAGLGNRSPNAEIVTLYRDFIDSSLAKAYAAADAVVVANDTIGIWAPDVIRGHVYRLAFHWYAHNIAEWDHSEFRAWMSGQVKGRGREIDQYCLFLANCAFLTLEGDRYRFLHRSFFEFLVAELAASELIRGDLTHWEVPFHSEIWEHIFHIIDEVGFEKINFDRVLPRAGPAAIGNVLLMAARHRLPPVLPLLRMVLAAAPYPTLRCVAIQGIGLYDPDVENARTLKRAFESEKNSIIRKIIQLTAKRWLRGPGIEADIGAELIMITGAEVAIAKQDAMDIARPTVVKTISPDIVHQSYRNALLLRNGPWNAYAIPILLLGAMQDDPMIGTICDIGTTSKDAEIQESFKAISEFPAIAAKSSEPALKK